MFRQLPRKIIKNSSRRGYFHAFPYKGFRRDKVQNQKEELLVRLSQWEAEINPKVEKMGMHKLFDYVESQYKQCKIKDQERIHSFLLPPEENYPKTKEGLKSLE